MDATGRRCGGDEGVGRQAGVALEAGNRAEEEVASSEAHGNLCHSGSRSEGPIMSLLDASRLHAIIMTPHMSMTMAVTVCDDY